MASDVTSENERKKLELAAALDAGLASHRAKPGVWVRVDVKVRRVRTRRPS